MYCVENENATFQCATVADSCYVYLLQPTLTELALQLRVPLFAGWHFLHPHPQAPLR